MKRKLKENEKKMKRKLKEINYYIVLILPINKFLTDDIIV